jgi:hypothetical protein
LPNDAEENASSAHRALTQMEDQAELPVMAHDGYPLFITTHLKAGVRQWFLLANGFVFDFFFSFPCAQPSRYRLSGQAFFA